MAHSPRDNPMEPRRDNPSPTAVEPRFSAEPMFHEINLNSCAGHWWMVFDHADGVVRFPYLRVEEAEELAGRMNG